jgi:hypothetical protein
LLLGLEGAESLVDKKNFEPSADGELAAPVDGFLGGGAEGIIHVEGEAEDHSFDAFGGDQFDNRDNGGGGVFDFEYFVGSGESAAFVAECEADAAVAEVN